METKNICNPSADMAMRIAEYLGGSYLSASVQMVGNIADAIIHYQDFKPVRTVRRELEQQYPNLNISEIHRVYSDRTRMAVMQELLDEDAEVYVSYADGSLRPIHMGEIVEEKLYNRTIG